MEVEEPVVKYKEYDLDEGDYDRSTGSGSRGASKSG